MVVLFAVPFYIEIFATRLSGAILRFAYYVTLALRDFSKILYNESLSGGSMQLFWTYGIRIRQEGIVRFFSNYSVIIACDDTNFGWFLGN